MRRSEIWLVLYITKHIKLQYVNKLQKQKKDCRVNPTVLPYNLF